MQIQAERRDNKRNRNDHPWISETGDTSESLSHTDMKSISILK